jgi:hypothetical protein
MTTKTKIIIWAIVLFVLFVIGFFWLLSHAFVIMTFGTIFKIAGAFILAVFISYWIGYGVCHHKITTKNEKG